MNQLKWALMLMLITGCEADIEVHFCPQDNCQEQLIKELSQAQNSIYFMTYSFTDNKIAEKLIEKSKAVRVEGLMEKSRTTSKHNVYTQLKNSGIKVKTDKNRATMHNKVFIIDEETVITGSYNQTQNGNEHNNENMVVIRDKEVASQYLEEFDQLMI